MYYISKEEQDPIGHGFDIYCFMEHDPFDGGPLSCSSFFDFGVRLSVVMT